MKTTLAKKENVARSWYLIDARERILGRMAVQIANLLRGRTHPMYTPHVDTGDYVIVTHADKIKLTGKKWEQKEYMFHTGYFGNEKYRGVREMVDKRPEFVIRHAVKGMLPKNSLADKMLKKLKIYPGAEHPHTAQQPIVLN